jgi:hypothetical protein
MVDRKVVPFDEFYYQLKLMYLFLLHVVCISFKDAYFFFVWKNALKQMVVHLKRNCRNIQNFTMILS